MSESAENYLNKVIKLAQDMVESLNKVYTHIDNSFGKLKGNIELLQKDVDQIKDLVKDLDKSDSNSKIETIKKGIEELHLIFTDSRNKTEEISKIVKEYSLSNAEIIKGKYSLKGIIITSVIGFISSLTLGLIAYFK